MTNRSKKRPQFSAREQVIQEVIDSVRKGVIAIQLETEFYEEFISNHSAGESQDRLDSMRAMVENMKIEEKGLLIKLDFYKKKKQEMIDKKTLRTMKSLDRYPETICMDQLKEYNYTQE